MNETLTSIEAVLAASLNPGNVRDISLYAFSKRVKSDGGVRIHQPRPVVVVGSVLEKIPSWADLLKPVSTGPAVDPGERCALQQVATEVEYDYESDSDLDDDEQNEVDGLSEDGLPSEDTYGLTAIGGEDSEVDDVKGSPQEASKYRVVMVPNVAYRTLRVGVFFMYTGKVRFLPLRSQGFEKRQIELRTCESVGIPACSPKSLYRLADTFGMKDLQQRAANAITHRLSPDNIVDEVFSSFFCRYADLHKRAMSIIGLLYDNPAVQQSLQQMIPRLVRGELPHAAPTLVAILQLQRIDSPRRVGRVGTELAAQYAQNINDDSSPFGITLNAGAQCFRPKWPVTTPAPGNGAPDPSPTKSESNPPRLQSPIFRPAAPAPLGRR